MVNVARSKAGRATFDQETTHALLSTRPDDSDIRDAPISDPHLRPIENIRIPIAARIRTHTGGIAARVGLGQTEAADSFAVRHAWEPVLFLCLRSVGVDWKHHQRSLHRDKRTQTTIAGLQFLTGQTVTDRV